MPEAQARARPRIHPALERNLRALTEDEYGELELSILAEGCRDAVVVWREENAILDGHNRVRICTHHHIPYQVVHISLPSLEAALVWQVRNQFAKRNLTPAEIAYYRGKDYLASKKPHGGNRKNESSAHFAHLKTGEEVAERHGVNQATVRRDAHFADAVDAVADALGDDVRTRILTGEVPITKQDVITLARAIADEPEVGKTALKLLFGSEEADQPGYHPSGINPHGVRDAQTALLLGRIRQECGPFTYGQLFEQVAVGDVTLVRHDREQLKFLLSLARKGEPDEAIAEVVALVGHRYKLLYSEAQLLYLSRLADRGVSDKDAAEIVRSAKRTGKSVYELGIA